MGVGIEKAASVKRQLLALYIDFLFANVACFLLAYLLGAENWFSGYGVYIPALLMAALAKTAPMFSIGKRFLSIDQNGLVDSAIYDRESVWLMILATLLTLDGTKQLVRWAQLSGWPILGIQPTGIYEMCIYILLGAVSITAGYLLFKLDWRGFSLTLAYLVFGVANLMVSWPLMNKIIADRTVERRAIQGLPVRPGEIEFMQTVTTPGMIGLGVAMILLLLWKRSHFRW